MATVLLTQKMDKVEGEANKVEEIEFENNKTSNCDDAGRRKEYFVENQNEESQVSEIVEKIVFLAGGTLLLLGEDYYLLIIFKNVAILKLMSHSVLWTNYYWTPPTE